jgi:hypothetical protein
MKRHGMSIMSGDEGEIIIKESVFTCIIPAHRIWDFKLTFEFQYFNISIFQCFNVLFRTRPLGAAGRFDRNAARRNLMDKKLSGGNLPSPLKSSPIHFAMSGSNPFRARNLGQSSSSLPDIPNTPLIVRQAIPQILNRRMPPTLPNPPPP